MNYRKKLKYLLKTNECQFKDELRYAFQIKTDEGVFKSNEKQNAPHIISHTGHCNSVQRTKTSSCQPFNADKLRLQSKTAEDITTNDLNLERNTAQEISLLLENFVLILNKRKLNEAEKLQLFNSFITECEQIEPDLKEVLAIIRQDLKAYSSLGILNEDMKENSSKFYMPTKLLTLEKLSRRLSNLKTEMDNETVRQEDLKEKLQDFNTMDNEARQKEYSVSFQLEQLHADCFQLDHDIQEIQKIILQNYGRKSIYDESEQKCDDLKQQLTSLVSVQNCMEKEIEHSTLQLKQILKHSQLNEEIYNKIWNAVKKGEIDDISKFIENRWRWYIS
ncbi:unnamed protein product [Heterobilharzia americana]|nr:unnamed protein product [Heterobilharzia americana]